MKFILRQNTRKQWRFDVVSGNGQVILASKPYSTERNARDAIKKVQTQVGACPVVER